MGSANTGIDTNHAISIVARRKLKEIMDHWFLIDIESSFLVEDHHLGSCCKGLLRAP